MKKNKFFPVLGMVLSPILAMFVGIGWYLVIAFVELPVDDYTGLRLFLFGEILLAFLFPIWFAWYATKHTKFTILPALYSAVVCILPLSNIIIQESKDGISYYERDFFLGLTIFVGWNCFCFAVMRLIRFIKKKHIKSCRTSSGE